MLTVSQNLFNRVTQRCSRRFHMPLSIFPTVVALMRAKVELPTRASGLKLSRQVGGSALTRLLTDGRVSKRCRQFHHFPPQGTIFTSYYIYISLGKSLKMLILGSGSKYLYNLYKS